MSCSFLLDDGGRLRLAAGADGDAPAAGPGHAAGDGQIGRRVDAAGVVGCEAAAGLEFVLGDHIGVETIGAARHGALREIQAWLTTRLESTAGASAP